MTSVDPIPPPILAAMDWSRRKDAFVGELAARLARAGVALGSVDIGRDAVGRLWLFGVRLPWGSHVAFWAPVADEVEVTGADVAADVARRVEAWLAGCPQMGATAPRSPPPEGAVARARQAGAPRLVGVEWLP